MQAFVFTSIIKSNEAYIKSQGMLNFMDTSYNTQASARRQGTQLDWIARWHGEPTSTKPHILTNIIASSTEKFIHQPLTIQCTLAIFAGEGKQ